MAGSRAQMKHQSSLFSPSLGSLAYAPLSILPLSSGKLSPFGRRDMATVSSNLASSEFTIQKEEGLISFSIYISILRHDSNQLCWVLSLN